MDFLLVTSVAGTVLEECFRTSPGTTLLQTHSLSLQTLFREAHKSQSKMETYKKHLKQKFLQSY